MTSANYVYIPTAKTFEDAETFCQDEFGTHLASIHDATQSSEIYSLSTEDAWLGLNDRDNEGKWAWTDGSDYDYTNWKPGEPNNLGDEDCTTSSHRWSRSRKWNDFRCSSARPFMCNRYPMHTISANYFYVPIAKTWMDAEQFCQDRFGTHLASIHNEAQNSEIYGLFSGAAWLGLSDRDNEGKWVWTDGSAYDFKNWYPGEPNNWGGYEDCTTSHRWSSVKKWNDLGCSKARTFMCNRYSSPPQSPTQLPTQLPTVTQVSVGAEQNPSYAGVDVSTGLQSVEILPSRVGAVTSGLNAVKNYRFYGWSSDVDIARAIVDASSFKSELKFYIEIIPSEVNDLTASGVQSLLDEWSDLKQYVYWIALGNEPAHEPQSSFINFNALPDKLEMVYDYLKTQSGWEHTKVSIPFSSSIFGKSDPVKDTKFKGDYRGALSEIIDILDENNGPFSVQWYPYFTCADPAFAYLLDYCLGNGPIANKEEHGYSSMLEAQVDATYYAMKELVPNNNVEIMVTETGWPTAGNYVASVDNARSYYENTLALMSNPSSKLYQKYIFFFDLFDEDKKDNERERSFGIYDRYGNEKFNGLDGDVLFNAPKEPTYKTSSNYIYVPIGMKWTEADQYCQNEFGTHLASIHNAEQNAEVFNIKGNGATWVGFNDISTERTWVWVDDSENKYSNWYPGQPDNSRGGDCAYIGYRGTQRWDDTACGYAFPFVCNRYDGTSS